jgi:hypothetical protein
MNHDIPVWTSERPLRARRPLWILTALVTTTLVLSLGATSARAASSAHHAHSLAYDTAQVHVFARSFATRLSGLTIAEAAPSAEVKAVSAAAAEVPGLRGVDLGGFSAAVSLDGQYFVIALTIAPHLQHFTSVSSLWAQQSPYDWRGAQLFATEVRGLLYGGLSPASALAQVAQSAPLTSGLQYLSRARFTATRSLTMTMRDGAIYKASWAAPRGWNRTKWSVIHPRRVVAPHGI